MKKLIILLAAVLNVFTACKDKNQPSSITCEPTSKTVSLSGDEFIVTLKSTAAWTATANQTWVSIHPSSGQGDAFVTITVAAGDAGTANVLFSNGEGTATLVITRGEGTTPDDDGPAADSKGTLPGKFSVSATTQVQFSKGNLQYQASTSTWRFAENQYDMIGSDNSNISASYSGWIDLFCWGTGNNPTNTSTDYNDYSTFTDWGVNKVSNGGNTANQWRTLKCEEWNYLFYGRTNAATLFGLGSVNGVNGTILLPDDWTLPAGVSFTASTTQGLANQGEYYYDENKNHFTDNAYTKEQWSKMESAGAVFLPAAGYRYGTDVNVPGSYGFYWSATPAGADDACNLFFLFYNLRPQDDNYRYRGLSVRLVR